MPTRFLRTFIIIAIVLIIIGSFIVVHPSTRGFIDPFTGEILGENGFDADFQSLGDVEKTGLHGGVIMGKLGNETAKAELGRAAWKLMHTMTLRYPETPTPDERAALKSYFLLQARLYPCGECAAEFMALLKKYPPQTSSRMVASTWLCSIHNRVNQRLGKPKFDCSKLDETYDCGCGEDVKASQTVSSDDNAPEAGMINGG